MRHGIVALALLAGCSPGDGARAEAGVGAVREIAVEDRRAPGFDAASAFGLLERQVAFGPRAPGSPGHAAQLEWMTSYLEARADTVWRQAFEHAGPEGETLSLSNVFARFRPELRDRVLLVAHWDTRPTADEDPDPALRDRPIPGANDGASGVAVLLQLADMFAADPPPIGVDLLLVDGEDYAPGHMYLGATHFATRGAVGYAPLYGVVVDMVADRSPRFPQEGYSRRDAPEVVSRIWTMAARLGYSGHFPVTPGIFITDDHVPLNEAGIRTANIIDFDYGPGNAYWHTHEDRLENVGPEGLEAVGTVLAELIYRGG
jgi:hypothetical protein